MTRAEIAGNLDGGLSEGRTLGTLLVINFNITDGVDTENVNVIQK